MKTKLKTFTRDKKTINLEHDTETRNEMKRKFVNQRRKIFTDKANTNGVLEIPLYKITRGNFLDSQLTKKSAEFQAMSENQQ